MVDFYVLKTSSLFKKSDFAESIINELKKKEHERNENNAKPLISQHPSTFRRKKYGIQISFRSID